VTDGWPRKALDELVALIYLATTDHEHWSTVIERIARRLGASRAAVHVHARPGDTEPATTVGAWGRSAPGLHDYASHYAARNIWLEHGSHLLKPGAILTGEDMCPDEVHRSSTSTSCGYSTFATPSARCSRAIPTLSYFSAGRPHGSRPFGDPQRRLLSVVTPHLLQAIRIYERLEAGQAGRRVVSGALDRLPLAVIFLDGRCRVVEMNAPARKLVEAGDGLRLERGVLVAFDTRADVQLQQMIFGAAAVATGRLLQHGGALTLARPQGRRPLSAIVAPTGATGIFPASRSASVVVLIEEPEQRASAPFAAFTKSYGLSPAEAGVASRLVGGMSLRQTAVALGIRDNTARSHLKRIFAKTGARRQSDLVRRVLTYDGQP
jgi:DNA-binding CsgD family transcriptional regulator